MHAVYTQVAQDAVDDSGALEKMSTNSRKRAMTMRMYLLELFRKAMGKSGATSCKKMEGKMMVDDVAVEAKVEELLDAVLDAVALAILWLL